MKKIGLLTLIFGLTISSCKQNSTEMKEKIITNKDIELYTENFGNEENPAILLIAGATVSMLYWEEEFCHRLADKGFYVIRYDHRDVGKSAFYEVRTTPYDIVDLTNDAIAILDEYKIESANLLSAANRILTSVLSFKKIYFRTIVFVIISHFIKYRLRKGNYTVFFPFTLLYANKHCRTINIRNFQID
jgi:hypothetical protein